ncbi:hypothetical protein TKK_0006465 [Trichogramma kaykai]
MRAITKACAVRLSHELARNLFTPLYSIRPLRIAVAVAENISTPEPSDISEDDHYSSVLMKDPDKLKLMLLAWNYQMQHQAQQQGGVVPPGLVGPQAAAAAVAAAAQQQLSNGGGIVSNSSSGGTGNGIASALSPANGATAGMTSNGGQTSSTQQQQLNANSPLSSGINVSSVNTSSSGNLTSSTLTDSRNGNSEPNDMSQSVNSASSGSATTPGGAVGPNGEDMATLWANYQISLKKTPPPGSGTPSRDRDRELSPAGEGAGSAHDETSSSGNKEDEDDDDEDVDERLDPRHHDPERLKAFNMFVRLFVDENLDRMTPISKQPKEKIQAIIDSCTRQFPEFAERARKRIRTYLKSCRRNKRGREGASWDAARPTPAHLTSVQAEQILATACENESDNAKRMRVGLEPVSQPMPTLPAATQTDSRVGMDHYSGNPVVKQVKREDTPPTAQAAHTPLTSMANLQNSSSNLSSSPLALTPSSKMHAQSDNKPMQSQATMSSTSNGIGSIATAAALAAAGTTTAMFRPNFGQAFQQRNAPTGMQPGQFVGLHPAQSFPAGLLSNGTSRPTDLSMKNSTKQPLINHKLNPTELAAVRALVTGYRESAAFLLRSADELEALLIAQSQMS